MCRLLMLLPADEASQSTPRPRRLKIRTEKGYGIISLWELGIMNGGHIGDYTKFIL